MFINFDRNKLEQALHDFSTVTGINIAILDENFMHLNLRLGIPNRYCAYIQSTETGKYGCQCSDLELLEKCKKNRKAQYHICHAGLVDVAVPISYENKIIGYLILGQMKKDRTRTKPSACAADADKMNRFYEQLPLFDEKKINSVINIAVMLTKYILLEKMLYPVKNDVLAKAAQFINLHLSEPLDIKKISDGIGYSVSTLYKNFQKHHHCTVGAYISERRIDYAVRLLLETDLPIEDISQKTGFSSAPYFSKTFKDRLGVSPLKFRKNRLQAGRDTSADGTLPP